MELARGLMASQQGRDMTTDTQGEMSQCQQGHVDVSQGEAHCHHGTSNTNTTVQHRLFNDLSLPMPYL